MEEWNCKKHGIDYLGVIYLLHFFMCAIIGTDFLNRKEKGIG